MSSSADISIFETPTFNIDNLKTSSETEIKVEYYINGVLDWSGFVIPDFFSKTIGTPATVEMVASDRLGTLKGVTLEDLNQYESMRDLAVKCLAKTGLTLPLYTMADFGNNGTTNAFFKALGLSGRLSDTKGRNISCYDILKSILVASNSKLVQQSGAWYIVNKWQHEQGVGNLFSTLTASTAYSEQTVSFSDVHAGARRTIIPVAATTGVFHEFGGGRSYPENYNFSDGTTGWTANGGFIPLIKTTPITSYLISTNEAQFNSTISVNPYLFNSNTFSTDKYLQSKSIIPYDTGRIEASIEINATGPMMGREALASEIRVSIGIEISTGVYRWLNDSGAFVSDTAIILNGKFPTRSPGLAYYRANTGTFAFKGTYDNPMGRNLVIRIYGSYEDASKREIGYNFVSATFKQIVEEPKGTIYKRTQGVGFTKEHDLDTTIFGDYLTIGLDGAFYQSRVDDTSYLYSTAGTLTEPLWTAYNDTEQLPLLQHVTRQKSRMFSLAHNMISARVDVATFKPLNIFVDCNAVNPRHVVVSASYDFLRSEVEVELEQIAYATLDVREFIYSYFGEGESGISSVGGISGGGTGGGGGMTSGQLEMLTNLANWWKLDEENDAIYSEKSVYSLKGVSALGLGSEGGGGGGDIYMLDAWANYTEAKADYYAPASLLVPFRNDTLSRLASLEAGGGGGGDVEISMTGSGNAVTGVSKSGNTLTFAKSSTFALATHNHDTLYKPIGYVPSWGDITGKPTTFAPGAHTHTIANITGLQSALNSKQDTLIAGTNITISGNTISASGGMSSVAWGDITDKPTTFAPGAHTHSASDITSGTLTIARIPTGTTGTTVALGNHLHTGVYEPVFAKNNAFNKNFGTAVGTVAQGNDSRILNGQTAFGWGNHASAGYALNSALTAHINKVDNPHAVTKSQVGLGSVDNTADSAKNVLSATKLTQARTIAGVLFDGTANIAIPFANLASKPTTLSGYGITDAVTTNTTQTITGAKTFSKLLTASAGINTPKVIFAAAGWSLEQVGTELQMKHNGVIKQRMLSDGTILATGGVTALATS
jgi:hypothetical protein